ncbi:hypothetical protein IWX90DRAFT_476705 [Phyllosticta citrichinensis]|uniref:Zn(2)-C6 fungal-type domain-containing protein n=1 Tax=Phyllosticta citrichinensis TaxID=1130410 RepID=A0ABR1Y0T8_9PEZI
MDPPDRMELDNVTDVATDADTAMPDDSAPTFGVGADSRVLDFSSSAAPSGTDMDNEDSMEVDTSTTPTTSNSIGNGCGDAIKTTVIEETDAGYKIIKPDGSVVEHMATSESEGQHEQSREAANMQKQAEQRTSHPSPSFEGTVIVYGPEKLYGDLLNQEVIQSDSEQAAAKVEEGIRNVQITSTSHDTLAESDKSGDLRAMVAENAVFPRNTSHAASHHMDAGGLADDQEASRRDLHDTDHFRRSVDNFLKEIPDDITYDTEAMDTAAHPQPSSLFGGGGTSTNAATEGFQVYDHDLILGSEKPNFLVDLANLNSKADAQAPEEDEEDPFSPRHAEIPNAEAGEDDAQFFDSDVDMDDDDSSEDNDDPSDGNYQGDGGEQNMDAEPCNIQDGEGSQEDGSDVDEAAHSYELRLAARQIRPIMTNIIDWDESGDYDPSAKRPPRTPDRRSKPKRQRENGEGSPTKRLRSARQLSPSKARQLGADWVVTLQLQSAAGKELLSKYPDNWPEERNSFSSNSHVVAPLADDEDDSPTKRCMRPRRRLVHYGTPFSDDSLPVIADPSGEQDDLRNHPAARGCVRCREVGEVCDLRKPGAVWPCVQCSEHYKDTGGHIPCELVTPPERKQECEPCQDQELECSYAVEEGEEVQDHHGAPCRQCAASGERCIAGPHKDAIRVRATYSPPPGVRYHAHRAYISCTNCRRRKKHCSLKNKEDEPPCVSCEDAGIDCTFERIIPVPNTAPSHAAVESVASKAKTAPSHATVDSVALAAKAVSIAEDATQVPDKAERLKRDQKPSMPFEAMQVDIKQPETGPSTKACKASTQAVAGSSRDPNGKGKQRATEAATGPAAYYAKFLTKEQVMRMEENAMRTRCAKKPRQPGAVKLINPQSTLHVKNVDYVPSNEPISASADEPNMEMEDVHGNKGCVSKLLTAFAHPIRFNLQGAGCKWCDSASYGLYGIGWRKPEVIAWSNQCGYTELEGGHRSEGVEAAFMCADCVRERFQITGCDDIAFHKREEFRSVWPLKMSSAEKEVAMAAQFDRLCNGKPAPSDKWCSICVAPASVECSRSRPGCALKLCNSCHRGLMRCGAGGLQQLLRQKTWSEKAVTELRADACFLQGDGILCRSVYENANKQKSKAS